MASEKNNSTSETKTPFESQDNVITSIIVKTVATVVVGFIAWYFLQNMI